VIGRIPDIISFLSLINGYLRTQTKLDQIYTNTNNRNSQKFDFDFGSLNFQKKINESPIDKS